MQSIVDRIGAAYLLTILVLYLCVAAGCWPQPPALVHTAQYEISSRSVRHIWVEMRPGQLPSVHLQLSEAKAARLKQFVGDLVGELIRLVLNFPS